jgi:hypothetical protein
VASNLDRYRKDLQALLKQGNGLMNAMQLDCYPEEMMASIERDLGTKAKAKAFVEALPSFTEEYQGWYSEAKVLIKQLLPDRLDDFVRLYEKPKSRKDISFENYRIEDHLQGLRVTQPYTREVRVDRSAAIPHFRQQLAILTGVRARLESSLFDIRQLVQADVFDSELDAAGELMKGGFVRAAGALTGVVLEKHLRQVCEDHKVKLGRTAPTISNLNDALKNAGVIELPDWRFLQHLADIRNLCDHNKGTDPTKEQVGDLIAGVAKTTKTLF